MTNEEAIEILKHEHDYAQLLSYVNEALKMAISGLEKQIPKKPTPHKVEGSKIKIGNGWWCEGTTVHKCPNCNEFISITYKYCYKCGQALDWSDIE